MKLYSKLIAVLFLSGLNFHTSFAQQLKGVATYKSSYVSSVKNQNDNSGLNIETTGSSSSSAKTQNGNSGGLSPETMAQIQSQFKKQMQKEYTLTFDNISSSWKEVESLDPSPGLVQTSGFSMTVMSTGEPTVLYKNTQEGKLEESTELMGKSFLIKDELPAFDWIITEETKQIGHYTCQKAIYKKVEDTNHFSPDMKEIVVKKDTITIEAWFTPEVPISNGPLNFWGLPGLIMELNTGNMIYLCSKILLNPTDEIKIERPKKGKEISRSEFQALQEEKKKQNMKEFLSAPGNNGMRMKIDG